MWDPEKRSTLELTIHSLVHSTIVIGIYFYSYNTAHSSISTILKLVLPLFFVGLFGIPSITIAFVCVKEIIKRHSKIL